MFYSVRITTAYDWLKAKAFGWVLNVARRLLKKIKVLKYYLNTIYTIHNMLIVMAFKKHKEKRYTMFMSTYIQYRW